MIEIRETIIGITEINNYLIPYLSGIKLISQESKLVFNFNNKLQTIDELFYAYLLIFKQSFPSVEINILLQENEITNKAYWIAQTYITQINLHIEDRKIRINGDIPSYYPNISRDFFPHVLVDKHLYAFKPIEKIFNEMQNSKFPLSIEFARRTFYILNNLKSENVLKILDLYNFSRKSPIEYYFLYLFIVRYVETEAKKKILKSGDALSEIFEKVDNIYKGLNELAKNMVEHSGKDGKPGFGVISARVFSKEKTEKLKNFGTGFTEWFDIHKNNEKEFLDINVIDAGTIGVTQHYLNTIQNDVERYNKKNHETNNENEKLVYQGLRNAARKDVDILRQYSIPHLFDYNSVQLNHQKYRANARIGLLIFSNLLNKREEGIVKAVTKAGKHDDYEAYCFYVNNKEEFKSEPLNKTGNVFIDFGTNYNFIIPITAKKINKSNLLNKNDGQGSSTSLLNALFNKKICPYETALLNENVEKPNLRDITVKCSYEIIDFYENIKKETESRIVLINADNYKQFSESDWVRFLIGTQFSTNVEKTERVPLIVYNMDKKLCQDINDVCKIYQEAFEAVPHTEEEKQDKNIVFGFWMPDSAILFYLKHKFSKYPNGNNLFLWFSNVLAGNTYTDYIALNRQIGYYQHNLYSIIEHDKDEPEKTYIANTPKTPLFVGENLLNFELLIKGDNNKEITLDEDLTLFEQSARNLLNLDIRTLPDKPEDVGFDNESRFFYNFKGYKVSDSHFSLGAKIHISDYYYAKRMFYNSFYANRFAFLITKYLLETKEIKDEIDSKKQGITLIGYSRYSELLISNTRRLLELQGIKNINHDVILEDGKALKSPDKIKDNVIIIIPIASTFSTSEKIRKAIDRIRSNFGNDEVTIINNKVINVLCVVDEGTFSEQQYERKKIYINDLEKKTQGKSIESAEYKYYQKEKRIYELYSPFGWKTRNNKIIKLEKQEQKYFIPLASKWHLIHNCELCFPENPKDEKCLLETGANAVTPESIFSFPITDNSKECDKNISFNQYFEYNSSSNNPQIKTYIIEKHACRDNKHFKHYIKADEFFDYNKEKIEKWLKENERLKEVRKKIETHKVLIITPSRTANSGFVNWVNQHVFSERATVLQYSDSDDILQNFIRFNASFFDQDSLVIFVDDVLHTATALQNINDYVKRIPPKENTTKKKIDCGIVMFDRSGFFDKEEVKNNLSEALLIKDYNNKILRDDRLIAYATINLPPIHLQGYVFPLVKKEKFFETLSNSSVTDTMKLYFKEQKDELKPYDFDKDVRYPQGDWDDLFHFYVFKALYSFFYGKFDEKEGLFEHTKRKKREEEEEGVELFIEKKDNQKKEELFYKLIEYVKSSKDLKGSENKEGFIDYAKREINTNYSEELSNEITYILATPPFVYYKDIREFAFYLVLNKLQKIVGGIQTETDFNKYHIREAKEGQYATPHCKFENFKHFLNLAADLKINYVFSTEMLKAIGKMLSYWKEKGGKITRTKLIKTVIIDEKNTKAGGILFGEKKDGYELVKDDFDIGFRTFYLGVVERLIKEDEAKAIKVVENIVEWKKTHFESTINPLRSSNNFDNQFIELLRNLVIENTFIFNTYIEEFEKYCEENKIKFGFDTEYNNFGDKIEKYYNSSENQAARQAALEKMLWDYEKENVDEQLKEAFFKTIYLKELLKSDDSDTNDTIKISKKVETILRYLSEILGMNENECPNGGAYFTIRFNEKNKPENKISEDDLYTIAKHTIKSDNEDEIDTNLTAKDTLVYRLYQGIKEKNSKKPESVIELYYDETEERNAYVPEVLEEYHSDGDKDVDINVNDEKEVFETGDTFGKRYKNLLFMRITDIKENKAYHEVLGKSIDEFKSDVVNIKSLVQNLKKDADDSNFSVNTKRKLFKDINENTRPDKIKDALLQYNRDNDYISNPIAVIVFYKCRLCKDNHYPDCEKGEKCENFHKRFDPKRLRFLMLLRDDIRNFCKHHFDNDSLREFVEEENKKMILESTKHMYSDYRDSKNVYIDRLKEYRDLINNKINESGINKDTYKEDVEEFEKFTDFLINKRELMDKFINIQSEKREKSTVKELIDIIKDNCLHILSFDFKTPGLKNYDNRKICIEINDKNISAEDKEEEFKFPYFLLHEIIFELIYNIRKAVIANPDVSISEECKLKIIVDIHKDNNNAVFLKLSNNKLISENSEKKINRQLKNSSRIKGLNLIYNCLKKIFDNKDIEPFYVKMDKNNSIDESFFHNYMQLK